MNRHSVTSTRLERIIDGYKLAAGEVFPNFGSSKDEFTPKDIDHKSDDYYNFLDRQVYRFEGLPDFFASIGIMAEAMTYHKISEMNNFEEFEERLFSEHIDEFNSEISMYADVLQDTMIHFGGYDAQMMHNMFQFGKYYANIMTIALRTILFENHANNKGVTKTTAIEFENNMSDFVIQAHNRVLAKDHSKFNFYNGQPPDNRAFGIAFDIYKKHFF